MSFVPRHNHPFTLEEAFRLDISTITAEIARLQHSLLHLNASQNTLQAYLAETSPPDPDLQAAIEENVVAISAQEERISILRKALEQKGAAMASNPHYEISEASINGGPTPMTSSVRDEQPSEPPDGDDDGVFL